MAIGQAPPAGKVLTHKVYQVPKQPVEGTSQFRFASRSESKVTQWRQRLEIPMPQEAYTSEQDAIRVMNGILTNKGGPADSVFGKLRTLLRFPIEFDHASRENNKTIENAVRAQAELDGITNSQLINDRVSDAWQSLADSRVPQEMAARAIAHNLLIDGLMTPDYMLSLRDYQTLLPDQKQNLLMLEALIQRYPAQANQLGISLERVSLAREGLDEFKPAIFQKFLMRLLNHADDRSPHQYNAEIELPSVDSSGRNWFNQLLNRILWNDLTNLTV